MLSYVFSQFQFTCMQVGDTEISSEGEVIKLNNVFKGWIEMNLKAVNFSIKKQVAWLQTGGRVDDAWLSC